jgi:hypothetical protein
VGTSPPGSLPRRAYRVWVLDRGRTGSGLLAALPVQARRGGYIMSIRSARPVSPLARLSLLLAAPCPPAASGLPVFAARRSEDFQAPCSASVTF